MQTNEKADSKKVTSILGWKGWLLKYLKKISLKAVIKEVVILFKITCENGKSKIGKEIFVFKKKSR